MEAWMKDGEGRFALPTGISAADKESPGKNGSQLRPLVEPRGLTTKLVFRIFAPFAPFRVL
jgi:hypothetical protein